MLTLTSHIEGQLELKIYYSNKMTKRPGDYTLHSIWSTLCTVEVIEAAEILHSTTLSYLIWTVISPFCVPVRYRAAYVGLKTFLSEGLSEPEFYGDLVYKFKKLIGINDFSFQYRKIITRYRRIGYNLNIMRQSACLVFNPIMIDNYAAFFNCTLVGRTSDSMMAPT